MSMQDEKAAIVKVLRDFADQVETADQLLVESFDVKADVERDFLSERVDPTGYMKFAPTGRRRVSIVISYHLPPARPDDSIEPPPIGADW